MDIVKILSEILVSVEATFGWYNKELKNTHVTFLTLGDRVVDYSEDTDENVAITVQIDVWSKDEKESMLKKKAVRKLMKNSEFGYVSGEDLYEDDTKVFHKALRYQILDEE